MFRAPRRNNVRLLLLMDVGGTMDPYFEPMSRLLTALHEEHGLRELRAYYFHNCIYERVYRSGHLLRDESLPTGELFRGARRALEGDDRRRRGDAPRRAARGERQHRPAPGDADARASSG